MSSRLTGAALLAAQVLGIFAHLGSGAWSRAETAIDGAIAHGTNAAPARPVSERPSLAPNPEPAIPFLKLTEIFRRPVGARGLEYSADAKALDGRRVRVTGFLARQSPPIPWQALLSPVPVTLHDAEFGLCDDLPASAVRVILPRALPPILPAVRGWVTVEGTLELGVVEEPDGRTTAARIRVDSPAPGSPVRLWAGTNSVPPSPGLGDPSLSVGARLRGQ